MSLPRFRLTPADLRATRLPFGQALTLPSAVYTQPEILALEQTGLFARTWLCVGRDEDLPATGDFFTRDMGQDSVVVIRGVDGLLRCFFNVCRHRGSRLIDDAAGHGLSRILCPYHAWSYRLDGGLEKIPRAEGGASRAELGLISVQLGVRDGFIFLNLDRQAPPLAQQFADLPDLSRFRLSELRCGWRQTYEVQANWKLLCENYSECYHCPGAHPQLARLSDLISRNTQPMAAGTSFNGGPMALRDGIETMSLSGRRSVPVIPGLPPDDHRFVYYYVIYPNLLLSPHPDYVLTHTAWPLAPDRTRVVCEMLFTEEALALPSFNPADMADFWDMTNRQDWVLCERAQRGARSKGYRPGPYQEAEDCVHAFDQWYAGQLSPLL